MKISIDTSEKCKTMYNDKVPVKDIMQELKVSKATFYRIIGDTTNKSILSKSIIDNLNTDS